MEEGGCFLFAVPLNTAEGPPAVARWLKGPSAKLCGTGNTVHTAAPALLSPVLPPPHQAESNRLFRGPVPEPVFCPPISGPQELWDSGQSTDLSERMTDFFLLGP